MALLTPTTSGEVYKMTKLDLDLGRYPSEKLSPNHLFRSLWQDILSKITDPAESPVPIDTFISLSRRNSRWKDDLSVAEIEECRQEKRSVLVSHPPDIILVDHGSPAKDQYGLHKRVSELWSYICINQYWVDQWAAAVESEMELTRLLGLELLVRSTILHEVGHWSMTLTIGHCPQALADEINEINKTGRILSDAQRAEILKYFTPKFLCDGTVGTREVGEAGDYVEKEVMGGLVSYSTRHEAVMMYVTSMLIYCILPLEYLQSVRKHGSHYYIPNPDEMPPPPSPRALASPCNSVHRAEFNHIQPVALLPPPQDRNPILSLERR